MTFIDDFFLWPVSQFRLLSVVRPKWLPVVCFFLFFRSLNHFYSPSSCFSSFDPSALVGFELCASFLNATLTFSRSFASWPPSRLPARCASAIVTPSHFSSLTKKNQELETKRRFSLQMRICFQNPAPSLLRPALYRAKPPNEGIMVTLGRCNTMLLLRHCCCRHCFL